MGQLDDLLDGSGTQAPPAGTTSFPQGQVGVATPSTSSQPAQAKLPPGLSNLDRLLNDGHATDKNTGENIPLKYSGNTPDTAMNQNPQSLSAIDRMKLSLGNPAGNLQYLKQRFKDVQPITGSDGKPSKELAVLDGNTWYRVNPVNGDIADPWEKTKEYLKDAVTYAPEALGFGMMAGAEAMTGGAATPLVAGVAGAADAAVRTSLGRIVGTYQATPQEQAWDIGLEGLMNAAGVKVLAGVKPTAKWVANNAIEPIAAAFSDAVPDAVKSGAQAMASSVAGLAKGAVNLPKAAFRQLFAQYSVGQRSFDVAVNRGSALRTVMNILSEDGGAADYAVYHDRANMQQLTDMKGIADQSSGVLSKIYGTMRNKILAQIPDDFSVNLEDGVNGAYSDAVKKGLGQIITTSGQKLEGAEAMKYIAENGMGKAEFRMFDQPDMVRRIQAGASLATPDGKIAIGQLANDSNAYNVVKQFYDRLGVFRGGMNRTGAQGAADLMDFNKVTTNLAQSLANSDAAKAAPGVASFIMDGKKAVFDTVSNSLAKAKPGLDKSLADLNNTYSTLSQTSADLLNKREASLASDNIRAFQPSVNEMVGAKGAITRNAVDTMINAARSQGLEAEARALEARKASIDLYEAAKQFNPIKPGNFKADQASNPIWDMTKKAANSVFESPNIAMGAAGIETLGKATVQGLWHAQQALLAMPKRQVTQLMNDPVAMGKYLSAINAAPAVRGQAQQSLNNMLQKIQQGQL